MRTHKINSSHLYRYFIPNEQRRKNLVSICQLHVMVYGLKIECNLTLDYVCTCLFKDTNECYSNYRMDEDNRVTEMTSIHVWLDTLSEGNNNT